MTRHTHEDPDEQHRESPRADRIGRIAEYSFAVSRARARFAGRAPGACGVDAVPRARPHESYWPTVQTDGPLLSDLNRYVGVAIALVGSFVAAPDGSRLLRAAIVSAVARGAGTARRLASRFIPALRRPVVVHV